MKKLIFIFILICYFNSLSWSQSNNIKKDSAFIFLFQSNTEYVLENPEQSNFIDTSRIIDSINVSSSIKTIKIDYLTQASSNNYSNHYLTNKIITKVSQQELTTYDINTGQVLSNTQIQKQLEHVDTVIIFDIDTYEEEARIIIGTKTPLIKSLYIKQDWYFDTQSNDIKAIPFEIIPMVHSKWGKKKLFRIALPYHSISDKNININDPQNTWIKESFDQITLVPSTGFASNQAQELFKEKIWDAPLSFKRPAYTTEDFYHYILKPKEEILTILNGIKDSSIVFDADTYTEYLIIKTHLFSFEEIMAYQIRQIWVFNEEKNTLETHIKSITPFVNYTIPFNKKKIVPLYRLRNGE